MSDSRPWFMGEAAPRTTDWHTLWRSSHERHQGLVAVDAAGRSWTFDALAEETSALAATLRRRADWADATIVAIATDAASFLPRAIGVWNAGGVVLPFRHDDLEADSEWGRLVGRIADAVESPSEAPAVLRGHPDAFGAVDRPMRAVAERPGRLARHPWQAIHFTSGSTGVPRAVVRGWRQAIHEGGCFASRVGLAPGERCTLAIDPQFGASTKLLMASLLTGARLEVGTAVSADHDGEPGRVLLATPTMLAGAAAGSERVRRYRWIAVTGEACDAAARHAAKRLAADGGMLLDSFGGSEFGVAMDSISSVCAESPPRVERCPGKSIEIVRDSGEACDDGEIGRFEIVSPHLAEGYLGEGPAGWRLDAFAAERDGDRRFRTDDLGVRDADGSVRHLGRSGSMRKRRGRWIDASPLVEAIAAMPETRRVALVGADPGGELAVVVQPKVPRRSEAKRIAAGISERFGGSPLHPGTMRFVSSWPINRHGKTDLARLASARAILVSRGAPRLERIADRILVSCECGVAKVPSRLRDLDLDSIDLVDLALRLERRLKSPVSPAMLLHEESIESLGRRLRAGGGWIERFGAAVASPHLLWFGGGAVSIRRAIGDRLRLSVWDLARMPGVERIRDRGSIAELARDCLSAIGPHHVAGRVAVGGLSFGAMIAHEAACELSNRGVEICRVILIDPPMTRMPSLRALPLWLRSHLGWLAAIAVPQSSIESRGATSWWVRRLLRDARRRAMLSHRPSRSRVNTTLVTSRTSGLVTEPRYRAACESIEVVSSGVATHREILLPSAVDHWSGLVGRMLRSLADDVAAPFAAGRLPRQLPTPPDLLRPPARA